MLRRRSISARALSVRRAEEKKPTRSCGSGLGPKKSPTGVSPIPSRLAERFGAETTVPDWRVGLGAVRVTAGEYGRHGNRVAINGR
jgi:hypothetical protein